MRNALYSNKCNSMQIRMCHPQQFTFYEFKTAWTDIRDDISTDGQEVIKTAYEPIVNCI